MLLPASAVNSGWRKWRVGRDRWSVIYASSLISGETMLSHSTIVTLMDTSADGCVTAATLRSERLEIARSF